MVVGNCNYTYCDIGVPLQAAAQAVAEAVAYVLSCCWFTG